MLFLCYRWEPRCVSNTFVMLDEYGLSIGVFLAKMLIYLNLSAIMFVILYFRQHSTEGNSHRVQAAHSTYAEYRPRMAMHFKSFTVKPLSKVGYSMVIYTAYRVTLSYMDVWNMTGIELLESWEMVVN